MSASKSAYSLWLASRRLTETPALFSQIRGLESAVPLATRLQVQEAFRSARAARSQCAQLPHFRRREALLHIADRIRQQHSLFAHTLAMEVRKPISDARVEVDRAIDTFTLAAEESTRMHGKFEPMDISLRNAPYTGITTRFPAGVISMIAPFNFPLNLAAHKIGPAIAAGCPFVLKPSDRTPASALMLGEILAETNLPTGAFSILPCAPEDADQYSVDENIDVISFTGSPKVGWHIKSLAPKKKVLLELGGNAACVVTEDANIASAAQRILFGAFYSAGQSCISVQRVFIHESIYDQMKSTLIEGTHALNKRRGDLLDENTFLCPMIAESEAKRAEAAVQRAVREDGARILVGGTRDGDVFDCTIVEDAGARSPLTRNEQFAPIFHMQPYSDYKKVLECVNDSDFGLQAGVFTRDINKAFYAYNHLHVGGVVINDIPSARVDSQAYGGVKESGVGREGLRYAIEDFTEIKVMLLKDLGRLDD
mmetsp:Transcript_1503/g.4707  ORF Transcript_1503/g.4707 Transcript_1503/m.4707 type:complete len:483 (-) Transcript_1503:148-1596(-)|eukprot:CAMPEP_0174238906 /NCGR_PEP_ID=MMETSP0417-20130205/12917_1 /TAXON_ID=242541 /ORGANISM="Mayorella sp, Strain BSH-02190019" /LENGTH=482 /DNA_ID=CAMNT_0015317795 /DNA_START=184 /DNA_END=1632 /DNA_ORIENTATION=+